MVAQLIFGPKNLPQFGKSKSSILKSLQSTSKQFDNEINKSLQLNEDKE